MLKVLQLFLLAYAANATSHFGFSTAKLHVSCDNAITAVRYSHRNGRASGLSERAGAEVWSLENTDWNAPQTIDIANPCQGDYLEVLCENWSSAWVLGASAGGNPGAVIASVEYNGQKYSTKGGHINDNQYFYLWRSIPASGGSWVETWNSKSLGRIGVAPWGNIGGGIASDANWVWADDSYNAAAVRLQFRFHNVPGIAACSSSAQSEVFDFDFGAEGAAQTLVSSQAIWLYAIIALLLINMICFGVSCLKKQKNAYKVVSMVTDSDVERGQLIK